MVRREIGGNAARLQAALAGGSVFVVRAGKRALVAAATADPTVGLVLYDMKSCLRTLDEDADA